MAHENHVLIILGLVLTFIACIEYGFTTTGRAAHLLLREDSWNPLTHLSEAY